jgi:hypothetical protein
MSRGMDYRPVTASNVVREEARAVQVGHRGQRRWVYVRMDILLDMGHEVLLCDQLVAVPASIVPRAQKSLLAPLGADGGTAVAVPSRRALRKGLAGMTFREDAT